MHAFSELLVALACMLVLPAMADEPRARDHKKAAKVDRSAKVQRGEASFYGPEFYGKEMSNGEPMKPDSNNAASKTLPLGTKAEVTNLENGQREVVVVEDRGPFVDGRVIDVSPKTAKRLGFRHEGVAPVKVKPLELPPAEESGKKASPASAAGDAKRPAAKRRRPPADSRSR